MKNTRSILYFLLLAAFIQRPSAWAQVNPPPGMVSISPGSFVMGDGNDGESDAPQGTVTVSGFYIDTNLVNGSLWQEVYNYATNNGYSFDISFLIGEGVPVALGDNYPAAGMDWFDAVAWCNARSRLAGLTPVYYTDPGLTQVFMGGDTNNIYVNWATNGFRLPTEAEWEKAARGGLVGQRFPLGGTISETNANYAASPYNAMAGSGFSYDKGPAGPNIWNTNSAGVADTSPVGYYAPNGYGLYDMAGNLGQWCWDWYGASYYNNFPLTDPQGPASGADRVVRNGGFNNFAFQCRTANRSDFPATFVDNDIGFRTVMSEIGIEAVTVQANPTNEGSVTINGTVTSIGTFTNGASVSIMATASNGFQLENWTSNGVTISEPATFVFTITTNVTLAANFDATNYMITVASSPSAGGTVTGNGTFLAGGLASITAAANPGYTFNDWRTNSVEVTTSNDFSFTVSNNETLVANFTPIDYSVTVNAATNADGSVSGPSGSLAYGTVVTNTATPNPGFQFTDWTDNGTVVSTVTNYTYTVTANETLVANFTPLDYTLTVIPYPVGFGTVSGGGTFAAGTSVTNTALTNGGGYVFVNWTVNGSQVGTSTSYIVTLNTNETVVANFNPPDSGGTITLIGYPPAGGTVSGGGTIAIGDLVTNTAIANPGYEFTNWTTNGIAASASSSYIFPVSNNEVLVGNFVLTNSTEVVIAYADAGGTVSSAGGTVLTGSAVTNTATASNGFVFANWTTNGVLASVTTPYSFSASTNVALVANFTSTAVSNTVVAYASAGGTVANAGGSFLTGSLVTNTATASNGFAFANWTTNGAFASSAPTYIFTVVTNEALVANFTNSVVSYEVNVIANPSSEGSVTNVSGTYPMGSFVTDTATANSGFQFVNWTSNGVPESTSPSYTVTVTTNETIVANFAPVDYTVTVTTSPSNGPAANLSGTFTSGSVATLTAVTNFGYGFVDWTSNGTVVNSSASFPLTVTGNEFLVANFTNTDITVTAIAAPIGEGSVSNAVATYAIGSQVTDLATASNGYQFANWTSNGIAAGSANPLIFTASTNVVLVANFTANAGNGIVTVLANPTAGGTINGGGSFPTNSLSTNMATANPGYLFLNWTVNGSPVSASNTYVFTVSNNETVLIANFVPVIYTVMVTSSPSNAMASLGGTFPAGSSASVMVTPNADFQFLDWTIDSNVVSMTNTYGFAVSSNQTLVANFLATVQTQAGNTVTVNASAGGSVSGGGTFPTGTLVTNTETPSNGFVFIGWTGAASGTGNPLIVAANSNMTITANFAVTTGGLTLTVLPNGPGTVSPNLNGQILQTGGSYTLTATPDDVGSMFSGWTGSITTNTNPLTVTLGSSMVLQANFTPNSFLSQQGTYNGLFTASNGVTAQTAGMLKGLTVGPTGTYSGALLIGGTTYPISGTFSAAGAATNQISRSLESGGPLTLAMTLSSSNNEPQVTGTVSGTGVVANLTAYVATLSRSSGEYTVLIPPDTNNAPPSSSPGGDSYLLITNDMGTARITGALADGTIFSQTTPVSQEGYVPIYATLYGSRGLLLGWINLDSIATTGVGLTWLSPKRPLGFYPGGFLNVLTNQIMLSPWSNPPASLDLLTNVSRVGVINGSNGVNMAVSTSAAGSVSGTSVSGAINPKTGQFTVTFGSGKSVTTGHGAILLNSNIGGGYILTKTNAQAIQLSP